MVKRKKVKEYAGVPYMHSSGSSSYRSTQSNFKRQKHVVLAPDSQPPKQPTFGERAASAAVGLAVANVPGAIYGAVNPFIRFPKKNMVSSGMNRAQSGAVNRSTMVKSGTAKVKKAKSVKVSPYLKAAIKKVSEGAAAKGFYQRTFNGLVGSSLSTSSTDYSLSGTFYQSLSQTGVYAGAKDIHGDPKTWFNTLVAQEFTSGNLGVMTVRSHCDLNFFTSQKIWHAASVLFNKKEENANPYILPSANLRTSFGEADGVQSSQQHPGQLVLNVLHSKVDITLKNLSNRTIELEIFECQPTLKFNSNNPLHDLVSCFQSIQDGSDDQLVSYFTIDTPRTNTNNIVAEGSIDAAAIAKSNGWHWTYVKRSMVLQPQEVCVHTVQGPSGKLDFKKLLLPATSPVPNVPLSYGLNGVKSWSKHLMMSVRLDPVLLDKQDATTPSFSNTGQRWIQFDDTSGALQTPVAVHCTESFRIAVPEIAGFVTQPLLVTGVTSAGGVRQPLNLRKNKMQITTLAPAMSHPADTRVVVAREENPAFSVLSN